MVQGCTESLPSQTHMRLTNIRALQDTAQAHGVVLSLFSAGMPEQIEPAINDAKHGSLMYEGSVNISRPSRAN